MANFYVGDVLFEAGGSISGSGDLKITTICDCADSTGTAGQYLSSTGTGLEWVSGGGGGIDPSILTAKGDLIVASSASTPVALPVGSNRRVLIACSACPAGVYWGVAAVDSATPTTYGGVYGLTNSSQESTMIGYLAGGTVVASGTVGIGAFALGSVCTAAWGGGSVAVGRDAMATAKSSCRDIAIGDNAMRSYESAPPSTSYGRYNIGIGAFALQNFQRGCNVIAIGCFAGGEALCNLTTASNVIVMGNNAISSARIKVAWTTSSDVREKALDSAGVPYGLDFVNQIDPIAYRFCDRDTGEVSDARLRYGFCAQQLLALETDPRGPVIIDDSNPDYLTMVDQALLPVLVKAVQELSAKNDALEARLAALEGN